MLAMVTVTARNDKVWGGELLTETAREGLSEYAHRDAEQFLCRHTAAARSAISLQARATKGRR